MILLSASGADADLPLISFENMYSLVSRRKIANGTCRLSIVIIKINLFNSFIAQFRVIY